MTQTVSTRATYITDIRGHKFLTSIPTIDDWARHPFVRASLETIRARELGRVKVFIRGPQWTFGTGSH